MNARLIVKKSCLIFVQDWYARAAIDVFGENRHRLNGSIFLSLSLWFREHGLTTTKNVWKCFPAVYEAGSQLEQSCIFKVKSIVL